MTKDEMLLVKRICDTIGSGIAVFIAGSPTLGLWTFTLRRLGADDLAAALLCPSVSTLQMPAIARARRLSFWFLFLFYHTVNALLCALMMEADPWCLWMMVSASVITLVLCIGFLGLLGWRFPITKGFWITGGIFGTFYAPIAAVAMIYSSSQAATSSSQPAFVLGLIHILITISMHVLRFNCQEGFQRFEEFPFAVAVLGICGASLTFIPDLSLSPYKTAALVGLVFRFFDATFILGGARDKINHFLAFRISWLLAKITRWRIFGMLGLLLGLMPEETVVRKGSRFSGENRRRYKTETTYSLC